MKKIILLIFIFLLLASLACSIGSFNFRDKGVQFDVSISEEQLNQSETRLDAGTLFSGGYQVDLQPDKAVITGTLERPDGREITGNVEVGLSAVNGTLQVNILAVKVEGIMVQDETIQRLQEAISRTLSQTFNEQQMITVEAVTITEDAIEMTVRGDLSSRR